MNGRALRPASFVPTLAALLVLSVLALGSALANPLPDSALLIHVHPWTTDFCQTNPITQCSQVIQYSEIEGDVEFDLFLDNRYGFMGSFSSASMTLTWPQDWHLTSFQDCLGGEVTTSTGDHTISLQIDYDPQISPGTWLLLGRFRVLVSGFGGLHFSSVSFDGQFYGNVGPALAGVECTYSYLSCSNLMEPCHGHFNPEGLELHVPQEGTAIETMEVTRGWNGGTPCPVQFMETADWMELDITWDDDYHGLLTVTVNAAGLGPGVYPGIIRAVSQVVTCAPVTVHVEPVAGVPEEEPTTRTTSWGELKTKFR